MRLNVQTMKNVKYAVEVNETDTVLDVKKALQQQHQLGEPDEQKLIHVGKILKDDQTLEAAKVKNNDLIVIMVSKKKTVAPKPADSAAAATPAPAAASPPATAASSATSATSAASALAASATTASSAPIPSSAPLASSTPATAASTAPASSAASATSALLTGAAYEEAVTNLMSFGFPHDQVVRALRAAFNNADRAAEYLFSGIPASALAAADAAERRQTQPAAAPAAAAPAAAAGAAASSAASTSASSPATTSAVSPASTTTPAAAGGQPGGVDFSALGDLSQLRTLLTSNPGMLPVLISQLAQSNPQLLQQLEDNPQAFLSLMQALGVDPSQLGGGGQLPADLGGAGAGGQTVIQITEEEKQQIDNLQALGFPRDIALEAWLLCDRNQELAAAYLLEHGGEIAMDDEAGGMGGYGGDMGGGGGGDEDDDDINPEDYME